MIGPVPCSRLAIGNTAIKSIASALVMIALWLSLIPSGYAQPANGFQIEAAGFSNRGFELILSGPAGETITVEASEDLIDWEALETIELSATPSIIPDPAALLDLLRRRFYRLQPQAAPTPPTPPTEPGELSLVSSVNVLANDTIILRIVGEGAEGIDWNWELQGSPDQLAGAGSIARSESDPAAAFYRAPSNPTLESVTVRAFDPANPTTAVTAELRLHGVDAELQIQPQTASLGVGGQQTFSAGINIPDIGFVPLNRVFWKVNGILGGTANAGTIDLSGRYRAPNQITGSPAGPISVEFSLTPEQSSLASALVTVSELSLTPKKHVFFDLDEQIQLQAQLTDNQGNTTQVPAAQLAFQSNLPEVVSIAPDGTATALEPFGEATISARHAGFNINATAVIDNHETYRIQDIDAIPVGSVEVDTRFNLEVTQPGVQFFIEPRLWLSRFLFFNFFDPPPTASGYDHPYVNFDADDPLIAAYDADGRIAQARGVTAIVERETGLVEVGDTPGSGMVQVSFDDGVWRDETAFELTFTRLAMEVSIQGSISEDPVSPYVSEWLDVVVGLSNPRENSRFMPRTPVRIRTADSEPFYVAYSEAVANGVKPLRRNAPDSARFELVREFTGYVAPVENATGLFIGSPDPTDGKITFSILPNRNGPVSFVVDCPADPGIPPQQIDLTLRQPRLQVRQGSEPGFSGSPTTLANNRVVQNAWVNVEGHPDDPPLTNLAFSSGTRFIDIARPRHLITTPGGERLEVAAPTSLRLRHFFSETGTYQIQLGLADYPSIVTEPIAIRVVEPDAPGDPVSETTPVTASDGTPFDPGKFLGGFKVMSPQKPVWKPGVPIDYTVQLYDGNMTPGPVGRTMRTIRATTNGGPTVTDRTTVMSISVRRAIGAGYDLTFPMVDVNFNGSIFQQPQYMDANGLVRFTITPKDLPQGADNNREDTFLVLEPTSRDQNTFALGGDNLYVEQRNTRNEVISSPGPVPPVQAVPYSERSDEGFYDQYVRIAGHGLIARPRQLPVATQRVRDAIADGRLPAGADHVRFTLEGTEGFAESLGSGVQGIDLGAGIELISSQTEGGKILVEAKIDAATFENDSRSFFSFRDVMVDFGDGTQWAGEVELFSAELRSDNENQELDLPLNAQLDPNQPVGTVTYGMNTRGRSVPLLDLELTPSIHAAWDANQNGRADEGEDLNGDGVFDFEDEGPAATEFRSALASNPMVGFERRFNDQVNTFEIRRLQRQHLPGTRDQIAVYGNFEDLRRLNRSTGNLANEEDPDGLPDFVSRAPGAESLAVRGGGNLADVLYFTAYNIQTTPDSATETPDLTFESLASNNDIGAVYGPYSSFQGAVNVSFDDAVNDGRIARTASVWVDREASVFDFSEDNTHLNGVIPFQYFGGILDQYFQERVVGGGFGQARSLRRISADRMQGYDPIFPIRTPTGFDRHTFGVDLDAAFYDSISVSVPTPRPIDELPSSIIDLYRPSLTYGIDLLGANRMDFNPNSPALLDFIPTIGQLTGGSDALSPAGLVKRHGGTSGGVLNLSQNQDVSNLYIESRTPGALFPGIHAGFLLHGRPDQQRDPVTEMVEDDILDVSLPRNGNLGAAAGGRIQEEDAFLGTPQPRRVMTYGSAIDKKGPIRTGARLSVAFQVTFDPEAFRPRNPDTFRIKSAISVVETPGVPDDWDHLIVASQSEGTEELSKFLLDAAVDLAVDLAAEVILNAITSGSYLAACGGGSVIEKIGTVAASVGLGILEHESFGNEFGKKKIYSLTYDAAFDGVGLNYGFKIPSGKALKDFYFPKIDKKKILEERKLDVWKRSSYSLRQPPFYNHCTLLGQPFSIFKNAIKSSYSPRTFGGQGSAKALGMKALSICIPADAHDAPGIFSAHATIQRSADIRPKEESAVNLRDLPWDKVFSRYPFADEMNDVELIRRLYRAQENPESESAATEILRALGRKSVWREMDRDPILGEPGDDDPLGAERALTESLYQPYKVRFWRVPELAVTIAPNMEMGNDTQFGDYTLTPNQTRIPVSFGSMALASRSNENAGARAAMNMKGVEMLLRKILIVRGNSNE